MMYKTGDTVVLKSGGPRMTVLAADSTFVEAGWFNFKGDYEASRFPVDAIEPYSEANMKRAG